MRTAKSLVLTLSAVNSVVGISVQGTSDSYESIDIIEFRVRLPNTYTHTLIKKFKIKKKKKHSTEMNFTK